MADATIEKDEVRPLLIFPHRSLNALQSHAGKVVERSWYQRSKHIFPASRWEVRRIEPTDTMYD